MDNEYIILQSIYNDANITQRQLSKITGLSLGSINILLGKMIKEGLIKIEKIPANRIAYMLTPKGMVEKINKTYNYIRIHYNYIDKTKEKIKSYLLTLSKMHGQVVVILENDEVSIITRAAIQELESKEISYTENIDYDYNCYVVVFNDKLYSQLSEKGLKVKNLLEVL